MTHVDLRLIAVSAALSALFWTLLLYPFWR